MTQTLWEYRVISIGVRWEAKADKIEASLNELGQQGWEVFATELLHNGGKLLLLAKRPLRPSERRRRREWPGATPADRQPTPLEH